MPGLGDLFGRGSIAEQIFVWGILNQVIQSVGAPYFTQLSYLVNQAHPVTELSPPDAASAVVRNYLTMGEGAAKARKFGVDTADFAHLVHLAGDAPGPAELAVALRRRLIPEAGTGAGATSFEQGIREGRLADKWAPMLKALAVQWPSPTDALQALLEGQVSESEGRALYERFGGDPEFFQMLFNTRGTAPSPVELGVMANRRVIPWSGTGAGATSFEQGILEGSPRNKWIPAWKELAVYLPPPRTVTAMLKNGSLTHAQALDLFTKQGLSPDLAAAYVQDAEQQASTADRNLTQTTIIGLYEARIIPQGDARNLLEALGYSPDNANYLVELADLRRAIAALNTAVARVHALYVGHKIDRKAAVAVLGQLKIPTDQISEVVHIWDLEESVNVKQLTPAQIVDAWQVGIIDQGEAQGELVALGYTPRDAWILLSIKAKAPQPNPPAAGPSPVGVIP